MSCNGCKGNCCDPVVLGLSPQAFTEAYINSKTGLKPVEDAEEIQKMWRLFTYKGASRVSPMTKGIYADNQVLFMYQCSNYDTDTKKCTDYENRPKMCRKYGVENPCSYDGCEIE